MMLKMRPSCENCDVDLPNGSPKAMICSYECTFCSDCVEHVIEGVCPNCGGSFVPRPARIVNEWRSGVSLKHHPLSTERIHKPVDEHEHRAFAVTVKKSKVTER